MTANGNDSIKTSSSSSRRRSSSTCTATTLPSNRKNNSSSNSTAATLATAASAIHPTRTADLGAIWRATVDARCLERRSRELEIRGHLGESNQPHIGMCAPTHPYAYIHKHVFDQFYLVVSVECSGSGVHAKESAGMKPNQNNSNKNNYINNDSCCSNHHHHHNLSHYRKSITTAATTTTTAVQQQKTTNREWMISCVKKDKN